MLIVRVGWALRIVRCCGLRGQDRLLLLAEAAVERAAVDAQPSRCGGEVASLGGYGLTQGFVSHLGQAFRAGMRGRGCRYAGSGGTGSEDFGVEETGDVNAVQLASAP